MDVLLDSSAILEYYFGTKLGEEVKSIIDKSEVVYLPNVVIGEVVSKIIRLGNNLQPLLTEITQFAIPIEAPEYFIEAGKKHAELRKKGLNVSLIDSILLVLSEKNNAKFLTKDSQLTGPNTILLKE